MYETRIPLYEPKDPPKLPDQMQQVHWKDAAIEAERALHRWLNLPPDVHVLLVDRATHALELAFMTLYAHEQLVLPQRTFRAVRDAARDAQHVCYVNLCDCSWRDPGWACAPDSVYVPTTLGGTAIDPRWFTRHIGTPVVYDCAHTAYPGMFKDFVWGSRNLAVLSFFPTKPLGAFGGGALIGRAGWIEHLRAIAWPTEWRTICRFWYPQTAQSYGLISRIQSWDERHRMRLRTKWAILVTWLCNHMGVEPCWRQGTEGDLWFDASPTSPHLLAYPRTPALEQACAEANLETGSHYPRLYGDGTDRDYITIPFWSDEVVRRLMVGAERRHMVPRGPTCPR